MVTAVIAGKPTPPNTDNQAPQIKALLEQAWALELGTLGQLRDIEHAAALYCEAARHGSAEAHYRSGLLYKTSSNAIYNVAYAKFFLMVAMEHSHPMAESGLLSLERLDQIPVIQPECLNQGYQFSPGRFDLERYIANLPSHRRHVAQLLASLAHEYKIPPKLALAIGAVESNFDSDALSPKQAMGVMQLLPATARRFNVTKPFDPEQNIRGGLAYLQWLLKKFPDNLPLSVAAYNAGEGAVQRYRQIPPYRETQIYVQRVLGFIEAKH